MLLRHPSLPLLPLKRRKKKRKIRRQLLNEKINIVRKRWKKRITNDTKRKRKHVKRKMKKKKILKHCLQEELIFLVFLNTRMRKQEIFFLKNQENYALTSLLK